MSERIYIESKLAKVHARLNELFDALEGCKSLAGREAIEFNINRLSIKHTELSEEINENDF